MKPSYKTLALTFALITLGAGPSLADNNSAKLLLHVGPKVAKSPCTAIKPLICPDAVTKGSLVNDPGGPI